MKDIDETQMQTEQKMSSQCVNTKEMKGTFQSSKKKKKSRNRDCVSLKINKSLRSVFWGTGACVSKQRSVIVSQWALSEMVVALKSHIQHTDGLDRSLLCGPFISMTHRWQTQAQRIGEKYVRETERAERKHTKQYRHGIELKIDRVRKTCM